MKILITRKHATDERIYLITITKINLQMKDNRRDAIIKFLDHW